MQQTATQKRVGNDGQRNKKRTWECTACGRDFYGAAKPERCPGCGSIHYLRRYEAQGGYLETVAEKLGQKPRKRKRRVKGHGTAIQN